MKFLITGFEPFGDDSTNPSELAVKHLPQTLGTSSLTTLILPTVFDKSAEVLKEEMLLLRPDVVICVGQAGGRSDITPEKVAINLDEARIADNEGNKPIDKTIQKDGPTAFFSSLPVRRIVEALKSNQIPSSLSYTAGTFVCNHIFYQLMYLIATEFPQTVGGFVHIPYIPQQLPESSGTPSLPLETIIKALEIIVTTCEESLEDSAVTEIGTTH